MDKVEEQCKCPVCMVPVNGKNLKKNSSIATIVACVRGIQRGIASERMEQVSSGNGPLPSSGTLPVPSESKKKSKAKVSKSRSESVSKNQSTEEQEEQLKPPKKTKVKSLGLVLTGVNAEDKQIIYSSHQTIQADLFTSIVYADYESSSCTHVIAGINEDGLCQRTVKYLLAVLEGKWIVSVDCTIISLTCRVLEFIVIWQVVVRRSL